MLTVKKEIIGFFLCADSKGDIYLMTKDYVVHILKSTF